MNKQWRNAILFGVGLIVVMFAIVICKLNAEEEALGANYSVITSGNPLSFCL